MLQRMLQQPAIGEAVADVLRQRLELGPDRHDARRHIASRIVECAESGDRTLRGLTEAGRAAANELTLLQSPEVLQSAE